MRVQLIKRAWTATSSALLCALAPHLAGAADARDELEVRADEVSVDARLSQLELRGNVHADSSPFHLSADVLSLRRTPRGIVVEGDGRLAFCPCLGTPLTVRFSGALVAPPGDLVIDSPRLLVFGVPIFWLPIFWLRASDRAGVLAPELAWRGSDGLFLGGGVHLPWRDGEAAYGVDLRAGAYLRGGVAASADWSTPASFSRLRYDRLAGSTQGGDDGLVVDVRGAMSSTGAFREELSWSADAVRGARGNYATTDVEAASRAFDRFGVEARARGSNLLAGLGFRGDARRAGGLGELDASGPVAAVAASTTLGEVAVAHATVDGGALRVPGGTTLAFVRSSAGALVGARIGPLGYAASMRALADAASDGATHGGDAMATARMELSAPIGRSFASGDSRDPWRHRIDPLLSTSGVASTGDGALSVGARSAGTSAAPQAPVDGAALIAAAGVRTALGRWGARQAFEVEALVGGVSALRPPAGANATGLAPATSPLIRWRAASQSPAFALVAEGGHFLGEAAGSAWVARARVGDASAWSLRAWVASRVGVDPAASRLLSDSSETVAVGFLSEGGWTGGARASIPWTKFVSTRGGVDVDFTAERLVAAVATLELRDACGCFRFRATGSRRMGREGVDLWVSLDVTPEAAVR